MTMIISNIVILSVIHLDVGYPETTKATDEDQSGHNQYKAIVCK